MSTKGAERLLGVSYRVRCHDIGAHLFEVTCRVESPAPDGQVLSMPAWIPGSYLIREYARHVVRIEAECRGQPLAVRKLDKASWQVESAGAAIVVRMLVYAADPSVRGASLDSRGGFFNGVCLFLRVHGREREAATVDIEPLDNLGADGWQVWTSLPRRSGGETDFGAFEAGTYDELIDHPVLLGNPVEAAFTVGGSPHRIAVAGARGFDRARLAADLEQLCTWHARLFGPAPPFDRYLFIFRCAPDTYGGLEHQYSSVLACAPDDLPRQGASASRDPYRRLLGLVSHEYLHAWLVKRIRPAEFVDADLAAETYSRQLWIFEGITSYYDDLALLRSGLITVNSYLELVGRNLTQLYRTAGRRYQTLEDASFDTWIKFYRPDENTPNAAVSYYLKGSLVALALDLEIRLRSDGRSSLDDVLRGLWQEYGDASGPGVALGDFERLAEDVTGCQLDGFFEQALRTTVDPPIGILLAQFGIKLNMRAPESAADAGGARGLREDRPRPWLGLRTQVRDSRLRASIVVAGGPAQLAGVSAGDELVALDGRRLGLEGLDAALDRLVTDHDVTLHVTRGEELIALTVRPVTPPKDTCYLTIDDTADPAAVTRRDSWLAPDAGPAAGKPPG